MDPSDQSPDENNRPRLTRKRTPHQKVWFSEELNQTQPKRKTQRPLKELQSQSSDSRPVQSKRERKRLRSSEEPQSVSTQMHPQVSENRESVLDSISRVPPQQFQSLSDRPESRSLQLQPFFEQSYSSPFFSDQGGQSQYSGNPNPRSSGNPNSLSLSNPNPRSSGNPNSLYLSNPNLRSSSGNPNPRFSSGNPNPRFSSGNPNPRFSSGNPNPRFSSGNPNPRFSRPVCVYPLVLTEKLKSFLDQCSRKLRSKASQSEDGLHSQSPQCFDRPAHIPGGGTSEEPHQSLPSESAQTQPPVANPVFQPHIQFPSHDRFEPLQSLGSGWQPPHSFDHPQSSPNHPVFQPQQSFNKPLLPQISNRGQPTFHHLQSVTHSFSHPSFNGLQPPPYQSWNGAQKMQQHQTFDRCQMIPNRQPQELQQFHSYYSLNGRQPYQFQYPTDRLMPSSDQQLKGVQSCNRLECYSDEFPIQQLDLDRNPKLFLNRNSSERSSEEPQNQMQRNQISEIHELSVLHPPGQHFQSINPTYQSEGANLPSFEKLESFIQSSDQCCHQETDVPPSFSPRQIGTQLQMMNDPQSTTGVPRHSDAMQSPKVTSSSHQATAQSTTDVSQHLKASSSESPKWTGSSHPATDVPQSSTFSRPNGTHLHMMNDPTPDVSRHSDDMQSSETRLQSTDGMRSESSIPDHSYERSQPYESLATEMTPHPQTVIPIDPMFSPVYEPTPKDIPPTDGLQSQFSTRSPYLTDPHNFDKSQSFDPTLQPPRLCELAYSRLFQSCDRSEPSGKLRNCLAKMPSFVT